MTRHSLADKDILARTATCSLCGPVSIAPINGGRAWICSVKKAESQESWRRRNPEKVAASRQKKSSHKLTDIYAEAGKGLCPLDGVVDIMAVGRGWMCGVRATEIGRTTLGSPTAKCSICGFFSTKARPVGEDGTCSLCRGDEVEAELRKHLAPTYDQIAVIAQRIDVEFCDDGLGEAVDEPGTGWMVETSDFDAYEDTEGWDYANPNLRTLGPPLAADDPWMVDLKEQRLRAKRARERRYAG